MPDGPQGKIFINYRRGDDPGFIAALYQNLELEFGADRLFMDVEGHIKPGDDFAEVLRAQVAQCDVLLAIIGPRWAELLAARAGAADDFVAIEIKAALDLGKRVIPVLVGGAAFPPADILPEAIRALARKNAVGLRPDRFKADCLGLGNALKQAFATAEAEREAAEEARKRREAEEQARAEEMERTARERALAGLTPEQIREAKELANWKFIEDSASPDEFRDHLARFAGGDTERFARKKLEALLWANPATRVGIEALTAFLGEFPKGDNAEAAKARLQALEAERDAARQAEKNRRAETEAWAKVAASENIADLEAFLKAWPSGEHAAAAAERERAVREERERQECVRDKERLAEELTSESISEAFSRDAPPTDAVDCSVFGPSAVKRGVRFMLQVFIHKPNDAASALALAARVEPALVDDIQTGQARQVTTGLNAPLGQGAKVDLFLEPDGLSIDKTSGTQARLVWRGEPAGEHFVLRMPLLSFRRTYFPIVRCMVNGEMIGRVRLSIACGSLTKNSGMAQGRLLPYKKAFLSYSSVDRLEVLKRAQSLRAAKIDVFQDILSLDPGERWKQKIFTYIGDSDLFLLFWSRAAKDSKWVLKEAKYALRCQKKSRAHAPEIVPVILEGPPPVLPPRWLSHIHFNDPICYYIAASER